MQPAADRSPYPAPSRANGEDRPVLPPVAQFAHDLPVVGARRGRYVLHQLDVTVVARLGSDFLEGILR